MSKRCNFDREGRTCQMYVESSDIEPHGECAAHVTCTKESRCPACVDRDDSYFEGTIIPLRRVQGGAEIGARGVCLWGRDKCPEHRSLASLEARSQLRLSALKN